MCSKHSQRKANDLLIDMQEQKPKHLKVQSLIYSLMQDITINDMQVL